MAPPRTIILAVVLGTVATGCFTGERPTLDDEAAARTGDAAIDAVLQRLDAVPLARFTAEYDVTTRFGGIESEAVVVHAADGRRSITINDIRFVVGDGTDSTCNLTTDECEPSINNARISDLGLTDQFYGPSFAARLRADANRRVDNTRGYTDTLAGQTITCVDIPLSGIVKTYCALDAGPLARYEGNDLTIEITSFSDVLDEGAFQTG